MQLDILGTLRGLGKNCLMRGSWAKAAFSNTPRHRLKGAFRSRMQLDILGTLRGLGKNCLMRGSWAKAAFSNTPTLSSST